MLKAMPVFDEMENKYPLDYVYLMILNINVNL